AHGKPRHPGPDGPDRGPRLRRPHRSAAGLRQADAERPQRVRLRRHGGSRVHAGHHPALEGCVGTPGSGGPRHAHRPAVPRGLAVGARTSGSPGSPLVTSRARRQRPPPHRRDGRRAGDRERGRPGGAPGGARLGRRPGGRGARDRRDLEHHRVGRRSERAGGSPRLARRSRM
ncbi:MAG: hypothetical protein AVDCRST_MAG50-1370, partial [uncultured Acidimicrobiales bacterium]